jgi:HK97 gp10 family phage protein
MLSQRKVAEFARRVGQHAADEVATRIRDKARQLAPVLTGRLRDSIEVVAVSGARSPMAVVQATAPYAWAVEFGAPAPRAPRPFMRQAAAAVAAELRGGR